MLDVLLVNGAVITVDGENRVFERGYVAVKDGLIAGVGSMEELESDGMPEAKRVMDMNGHAVLPGLVDAHGHGGHCLLKTLGEHYDDEWNEMAVHAYYRCTDTDFWYNEGALAAAERIKFGTTTAVSMVGSDPKIDSVAAVDANLAASSAVGIRQFSGIGFPDGPWPKTAVQYDEEGGAHTLTLSQTDALQNIETCLRTLNGKYPRATCIVAPGRMGRRSNVSEEDTIWQNKEMARLAEEYDVPLHTHAYSGDVKFMYETSPEALSPRISLTHSTGYSDEELEILKETGAWVLHGPTTYSNAMWHCRVMDMLEKGINFAIVTDGTAPDRSYDLWRDMKNIQVVQRYVHQNYGLMPCGTVLRLATIEPARALGIDHLVGSLEVGKKADIITVNVMQPHLAPFRVMPIQRLVSHAMGQDVDNVIVEGEVVMENRRLTRVDEAEILQKAAESFEKMLARLDRTDILENPNLYGLNQYV